MPKLDNIGKVGVRSQKGRLSLRLPRSVFSGQQKIITLGLSDTPENRRSAEIQAREIELDIRNGNFDYLLNRYKSKRYSHSLVQLYETYMLARQDQIRPSTWRTNYESVLRYIQRSPFSQMPAVLNLCQAYQIYDWAIANWSVHTARKLMVQINACFNWAIERGLVSLDKSPFEGFAGKVRKAFKKKKSPINSFTAAERDAIIQAFQEHERYGHFCNYVRFCFFTGCRPSEAIGLEWDDIAPDFSWIRFHQAVVGGVRCEGLKTQQSRIFPSNDQLKEILADTRQQSQNQSVFSTRTGKLLSLDSFNGFWRKILDCLPIAYRSPYHTRQTFITLCLENGLDAKDVARLVGNSAEIIYKHYPGSHSISVPTL